MKLWLTYDTNRLDLLNRVKAILLPHGLINLSNEELLKIRVAKDHPLYDKYDKRPWGRGWFTRVDMSF